MVRHVSEISIFHSILINNRNFKPLSSRWVFLSLAFTIIFIGFLLVLSKLAQLTQIDLLWCRLGGLLVFEIWRRPEDTLNVLQFPGGFVALISWLATWIVIPKIVWLQGAVLVLDLFWVVRLHDRRLVVCLIARAALLPKVVLVLLIWLFSLEI